MLNTMLNTSLFFHHSIQHDETFGYIFHTQAITKCYKNPNHSGGLNPPSIAISP